MALNFSKLLTELSDESGELMNCLDQLRPDQWEAATPAVGWAIRDHVSHLAYFDDVTVLAVTDVPAFRKLSQDLISKGPNFPDYIAAQYQSLTAQELLDWFWQSRRNLVDTFAQQDPRSRLPWFGPDMSVGSSATARLMETWAHGQDVYDTLGIPHPPCAGMRSIAHLGVSTFAFSFRLNGREVPEEPVLVQLHSSDGELHQWGPTDASNRITGDIEEFVSVVTQRRHWTDTSLRVEGDVAEQWLDVAQAFAGAPGTGRAAAH